ncbi:glycosyltransferase [Edwardsiella tarda]|uniref:glycosyltransferase n=1 Tax=Edwardsiella tarda TaxID=636 RepID=UPI00351C96E8
MPSLKNVGPNKVAHAIISKLIDREDVYIKVFYIKKEYGLTFPCDLEHFSLYKIFKLYKFDVLHSHMLRPDILVGMLPWFHGKKISTVHNIVTLDLYYSYGRVVSKVVSFLWLKLWRKFDSVIVLSKNAKKFYEDKIMQRSKLRIIYNGVETTVDDYISSEDHALLSSFKKDSNLLGSLCLANERKGLEQVLYALTYLPNYKFILIGDGPVSSSLKKLSYELNIQDRFLILGFRDNARSFFKYIDYFVIPSRSEGFPLALIEAVVAKRKVICSDLDIFKEVFNNKEVSFFKLDDIQSLVEAIKQSEYNDVKSAHERMLINYSSKAMAEKYLECYVSGKDNV